ncbi:MAG TPA: hypothetical protein VMI53_08400 [Opitutaceae bacterium]|nr:hypothetical protein [Opitutaceae bacterium]
MSRLTFYLGRIFLPALLAFAVSARAETTALPKPETVADSDGRFVAKFPGPVQRQSQPVETDVGKVAMNMVYYDAGAMAYMVIYCDYPAGTVEQRGGPENVCDKASKSAVKNVDGTIRTSSPCRAGEVKGLEILADIPAQKAIDRIRFFVVGDRLYQVIFAGPAGEESSPTAQAFFDSFRLTR